MPEFIPILIALACPLGMVAMMALPALGRLFRRRARSTTVGAG